jgi:hypothetical protein
MMRRSTDAGTSFGKAVDIAPLSKPNPKGIKDYDWTGNTVPVLDNTAGRPASVLVLYCHNNQDVFIRRSTDFGVTFNAAVNISAAAHAPGMSRLKSTYFTGPGGAIQLRYGKNVGRILVPVISIYSEEPWINTSVACNVKDRDWCVFARDHTLISDGKSLYG